MEVLGINKANGTDFEIVVVSGVTKQGDYRVIVPDVPRELNSGYQEIKLLAHDYDEGRAITQMERKLSQWLYERIDDGKPLPKFSDIEEVNYMIERGQFDFIESPVAHVITLTEKQVFAL